MLTSAQILETLSNLGAPGMAGRVSAMRRFAPNAPNGPGGSALTPAQRDFLTAAAAVPIHTPATYDHPAASAALMIRTRGPERNAANGGSASITAASRDTALTQSEHAWLQRLPANPAAIPFDDAKTLAGLLQSVSRPDDLRLMHSIADPVLEYHDHQQAQVDLANATAPIEPAPHQALPALADAVAAENNQLEPDEVVNRAANLLRESGLQRLHQQTYKINDAQQRVDRLQATANARLAMRSTSGGGDT